MLNQGVDYSQLIRQVGELLISIALLAFAAFLQIHGGSGELVGSIVSGILVYWVNRTTQASTTRGLQETTQRALNGPLTAITTSHTDLAGKIEGMSSEINNLKVLAAYINRAPQEVKVVDQAKPVEVVETKQKA